MRQWEIQGRFGLDALKQTECPPSQLGDYDVRISVTAVSLNYRDLLTVQGIYNPRQPLPLRPASDGVGIVSEVGRRVTRVKVGDRVCGAFLQRWIDGDLDKHKARSSLGGPLPGMLAEEVVLDEQGIVKPPAHLTDEECATLPCAAVTAWRALVVEGHIKSGDTVLVQGTGGVSLFALQFAKMAGARVLITSSSDQKLERAKALGADEMLNYRSQPDWDEWARGKTGGEGVDHVVEVGGAGTFERSLRAARMGGHISVIGVLAGFQTTLGIAPVLMNSLKLHGIYVGSRQMFEAMNRAIEANGMRPVVDRVFPFDQAVEALQMMESGEHFGKICIRVREP